MSNQILDVVQGTVVRIVGEVTDPDSGQLVDPPDFAVTVLPPGLSSYQLKLSTGEVVRLSLGRFQFRIDTTPAAGVWRYESHATGTDAVVKQRKIRVTPDWG